MQATLRSSSARLLRWCLRILCLRALPLLVLLVLVLVLAFAVQARLRLPELQAWHRTPLAAEFRADDPARPRDFAGYLQLEDRLFGELEELVRTLPAGDPGAATSRYDPASVPGRLARNGWNRSQERVPAASKGAVLLVHGLTDSPYMMRALADLCFERGLRVLCLRLPGHGTVPAGLVQATWQDWYAAVDLALRHLALAVPGKPLYACGFSTGAALLTLQAIRALHDDTAPRLRRLFLVSAAIGVSDFAAIANVVSALSFVPYFERAKWLDVLPEYDPYKYNSFPTNAGNQIWRLTQQLRTERDRAQADATWPAMPKVLAFQSVVDATVSASDVAQQLFAHLRGDGHELVAFDVNREDHWASLVAPGPRETLERIRASGPLPYRISLVANVAADSANVALYTRDAGSLAVAKEELDLAWPKGVFSLGHVAMPLPPDDPVYGIVPREGGDLRWQLGLPARGEAGAILVPQANLARLRSNPLFAVVRRKILAALAADLGG